MYALDDYLGFAAAGCVLLTFCMKSMWSLRLVAISGNVLFIAYAYRVDLVPVLVLHMLLLPINVACFLQLLRSWRPPKGHQSAYGAGEANSDPGVVSSHLIDYQSVGRKILMTSAWRRLC
jgi:hypothetical protein